MMEMHFGAPLIFSTHLLTECITVTKTTCISSNVSCHRKGVFGRCGCNGDCMIALNQIRTVVGFYFLFSDLLAIASLETTFTCYRCASLIMES